jgi:adenylosuccinate lyase
VAESSRFVGSAPSQVDLFAAEVKPLAKRVKGAFDYRPTRLL